MSELSIKLRALATRIEEHIDAKEGAPNRRELSPFDYLTMMQSILDAADNVDAIYMGVEVLKHSGKITPTPFPQNRVSTREVFTACARVFNVTLQDILGLSRAEIFARPRQIACFICHDILGKTCGQIQVFIDRDHATILHGCNRIRQFIDEDLAFKARVNEVLALLCLPSMSQDKPQLKLVKG